MSPSPAQQCLERGQSGDQPPDGPGHSTPSDAVLRAGELETSLRLQSKLHWSAGTIPRLPVVGTTAGWIRRTGALRRLWAPSSSANPLLSRDPELTRCPRRSLEGATRPQGPLLTSAARPQKPEGPNQVSGPLPGPWLSQA